MNCSRREFLTWGAGGLLAARLAPLLGQEGRAKAKRCIVLWMAGGPSHVDTWDLKKGPIRGIETVQRGVRISEHLPQLAKAAGLYTILRSVTSREADHERATVLLHTGNLPQETVTYPTLGAVASKEWPAGDLPVFVAAGGHLEPGFLGLEHAPFTVNPDNPADTLAVPEEMKARFAKRLELLESLDRGFGARSDAAAVAEEVKLRRRALALMGSKAAKAFDIAQEPEAVRAAYGDSPFGRGCLLARRLAEHGVRFVEVALDGWDTHENNFGQVPALCGALDPAMGSLLRELEERRLLEETLVVWMGEFGRTPEVNRTEGRDHHSAAFSAVLAGGGIARGRVVGATDDTGTEVKERPVPVPDLFASLFHALGFDPQKEYVTPEGRPIKLVPKGAVVRELFA